MLLAEGSVTLELHGMQVNERNQAVFICNIHACYHYRKFFSPLETPEWNYADLLVISVVPRGTFVIGNFPIIKYGWMLSHHSEIRSVPNIENRAVASFLLIASHQIRLFCDRTINNSVRTQMIRVILMLISRWFLPLSHNYLLVM